MVSNRYIMSTESNSNKANDKLHPSNLGETKDFNDLSFNDDKQSYELDVKEEDTDYDHPMPYDTVATGAVDDNSTFDEANPYVGDEYADKEEVIGEGLGEMGMHLDNGESVILSPEDEILARTPEDDRDDLDEEGYPVNDSPVSS
jgi:hypothetical protein